MDHVGGFSNGSEVKIYMLTGMLTWSGVTCMLLTGMWGRRNQMKKILGIFGIILSIATILLAALYIFDVVNLGYSILTMIACVVVFGIRRFAK